MTKEDFMRTHPDFAWWMTMSLLILLVAGCGVLYRYKHPPVEHDERHHHYGSMMLWLMVLLVLSIVGWVMSAIWHREFWAMLHSFLS